MRLLPLLLAAAVLAAALPAQAQPPAFTQAYQVRGAVGDIPTTAASEKGGLWNLEQRLTLHFTNTSAQQYAFTIPAGATLTNATCGCPAASTPSAGAVQFSFGSNVPSGTYTLVVATSQPYDSAFGFSLTVPSQAGAQDRVAILYVPLGLQADSAVKPSSPGTSTDGSATIQVFQAFASPFWASVHPTTQAAAAPAKTSSPPISWPVALVAGLVVGAVAWALLVSRGVVQRKGRRQVASTAAHVEAAAAEPPAVLEGKKRALMAALKEVEVAKMHNEMAPEVYDAVKADLKRQTVTVMRALEETGAAKAD